LCVFHPAAKFDKSYDKNKSARLYWTDSW